MTTGNRSTAPTFSLLGVTWACWIVDGGQAYEWHSSCEAMAVGRAVQFYWARAGQRIIGKSFPTLRLAMVAAIEANKRRAA